MSEGKVQERQLEITRAYGVLATSLNESLEEARVALEPHRDLLWEGALADIDVVLAEFARRRIRVAVYGEVKAGKSTLINAIAGRELSPVAFDPLTSVPIRLTYGVQTRWRAGARSFDTAEEVARVMRDGAIRPSPNGVGTLPVDDGEGFAGVSEIVVETDLDLLQLGGQLDLLDTPGVGSDERFDAISSEALRSLDAVILVVRYPALFTQFTRSLMQGLEGDIGKLFVVWNLDADCAELSEEERARHAGTLRANVAGAHDLFLVDARAGFRAHAAGDAGAVAASGLASLAQALRRFASSQERELAALREAAKRAQQWLADAERALSSRRTELAQTLDEIRGRLSAVRNAAEEESAKVRARHAEFQAAVGRTSEERRAAAAKLAAGLGKGLRAARRRWIRRGDFEQLRGAVAAALRSYADAVETLCRDSNEALHEAARTFDTRLGTSARARSEPAVEELTPGEREARSTTGHARWLRRAVWRRWYLPGVESLLTVSVKNDLVAQETWFEVSAQAAERAAAATRGAKLEAIERRAQEQSAAIRAETDFEAKEGEFEALRRHLPIVGVRLESVREINAQARALLG
jgi:hypothetical protein